MNDFEIRNFKERLFILTLRCDNLILSNKLLIKKINLMSSKYNLDKNNDINAESIEEINNRLKKIKSDIEDYNKNLVLTPNKKINKLYKKIKNYNDTLCVFFENKKL